jgi:hypothetical protein
MEPLRSPLRQRVVDDRVRLGKAVNASRHYARNLVVDVGSGGEPLPAPSREPLLAAAARLTASIEELVEGSRQGDVAARTYVRSAALFDAVSAKLGDRVELTSPLQLALRDLELIDGTLAALAESMGVRVEAFDGPESKER